MKIRTFVDKQLNDHMSRNCLQFPYKQFHNTETMMLGITDEGAEGAERVWRKPSTKQQLSFLDLSAAFDTIDVDKALEIMESEIGDGGVVLQSSRSFLEDRTQRVKIDNEYSEGLYVPCGVL